VFAADRIICGLAAALVLYGLNGLAHKIIGWQIKGAYGGSIPAHPGMEAYWEKEVVGRTPGGWLLGLFEVLIFYASLQTEMWAIAASYIALKLASKWKSWTTTWQAFRPIRPSKKEQKQAVDATRAHLARAALDHRLFVLNTAGNIVAAIGGYAIGFAAST
jgi:hypothetical protein